MKKEVLEREGAKVETDLENIFTPRNQLKVIVMSQDALKTYQSQIKSTSIPIVDQEWVRLCLLDNRFLLPDKFSILPDYQPPSETTQSFQISNEDLTRMMERVTSSERMMNYLMNCVIYISKLENKDEETIQQKLIHMGGGAHLFSIIPNVTHIVADKYTEEQGREFTKFSNAYIVSTRWLRECLFFKSRVPEGEYLCKPTKMSQVKPEK